MKKGEQLVELFRKQLDMLVERTSDPSDDEINSIIEQCLLEVLGPDMAREITEVHIVPVPGSDESDITFSGSQAVIAMLDSDDAPLHS